VDPCPPLRLSSSLSTRHRRPQWDFFRGGVPPHQRSDASSALIFFSPPPFFVFPPPGRAKCALFTNRANRSSTNLSRDFAPESIAKYAFRLPSPRPRLKNRLILHYPGSCTGGRANSVRATAAPPTEIPVRKHVKYSFMILPLNQAGALSFFRFLLFSSAASSVSRTEPIPPIAEI